ncbi:four-carbon acid sugar kinase family protein [Niabella terrae]
MNWIITRAWNRTLIIKSKYKTDAISDQNQILLAFYGDDFTGSTDALEFISRSGARAVLFTGIPDADLLGSFQGMNVYGIAGTTRALLPEQMEQALLPALKQMQSSGARHIHYKVCSTFDSSLERGSIGKVIDLMADNCSTGVIPILGGTPSLGRYCVFGNLFARMGIGTAGAIYRLDRHPSMRQHPVTPADESDLRIHLGRQTERPIGLIDFLQQEQEMEHWLDGIESQAVLLDALDEAQLLKIGHWLNLLQQEVGGSVFSIGASAVEKALGTCWNLSGELQPRSDWPPPGPAQPLLVVSGSCSPVTASQISWALAHGFQELVLDPEQLRTGLEDQAIHAQVAERLQTGQHLIVHTGDRQQQALPADQLGRLLGSIALRAVQESGLKRLVIAGGDTSSYTALAMGIEALEMHAPLITGAPLCVAFSRDPAVNGLEVNFKGGQLGPENYFEILSRGSL